MIPKTLSILPDRSGSRYRLEAKKRNLRNRSERRVLNCEDFSS